MAIKFHNRSVNSDVCDVLTAFTREVERAAKEAANKLYNISDYRGIKNPKIKGWYDVAKEFVLDGIVDDFIYARYGYAVEECVNLRIEGGSLSLPAGYEADTQITHGGTRPDIVIRTLPDKKEIAWLDITSERSEDHVLLKSGDWKRARPFVAEIMYTSLSTAKIVDMESADPYIAAQWVAEAEAMRKKYMDCLIWNMDAVFESPEFYEPLQKKVNITAFAGLVERAFKVGLPYNRLIVTHSLLETYIDELTESDAPIPPWANILKSEFRKKGTHKNIGKALSYVRESYRANEALTFAAGSARPSSVW